MLTILESYRMSVANRLRILRILREIDAPRNQAIAEARVSARFYIDQLV